jgi:hypothetical protein
MKSLRNWWFIGMICLGNFLYGQSKNLECKPLHEGKFLIKDPQNGNLIIERNKKYQKEIAENGSIVLRLKVNWIDDCTYELHFDKVLKAPNKKAYAQMMQQPVRIEILEINEQNHKIRATMDGAEGEIFFTLWHAKK